MHTFLVAKSAELSIENHHRWEKKTHAHIIVKMSIDHIYYYCYDYYEYYHYDWEVVLAGVLL